MNVGTKTNAGFKIAVTHTPLPYRGGFFCLHLEMS